jgi:hypothetical protein
MYTVLKEHDVIKNRVRRLRDLRERLCSITAGIQYDPGTDFVLRD